MAFSGWSDDCWTAPFAQKERDDFGEKGVRLRWFLLHRGGKLEDFSITWFCDRALIPGRKIQDMFIHPRKEIQMMKKFKRSIAVLAIIAVIVVGLVGCKEGPLESAGKKVDKAVEDVKK